MRSRLVKVRLVFKITSHQAFLWDVFLGRAMFDLKPYKY